MSFWAAKWHNKILQKIWQSHIKIINKKSIKIIEKDNAKVIRIYSGQRYLVTNVLSSKFYKNKFLLNLE